MLMFVFLSLSKLIVVLMLQKHFHISLRIYFCTNIVASNLNKMPTSAYICAVFAHVCPSATQHDSFCDQQSNINVGITSDCVETSSEDVFHNFLS